MNYTVIENPYENESTVIATRGVMTDAKVAKLNNDKKKPALIRHWESLRPEKQESPSVESAPKDYQALLNNVGITAVNYGTEVNNTGAKKLRVNKIVNEKARNVYNNSSHEDVIPEAAPVVEKEVVEEEITDTNVTSEVVDTDVRGRHEKTAEINVEEIKEAIKEDAPTYSRIEKNQVPETKPETKAGDMDLYNNLLHSVSPTDDVSRQLQGARNQLSIEKEESRKLAEQYGEAVKELEKLKEEVEVTKKQKEQKAKEELSMTLKSIENLQKENLERTSDLTSIQSEIARLKAEKQAMEANDFE